MAKIAPFRAVHYNPEAVDDLSKVVCPPYDIISPARQKHYHELHPHNFLHILLGKDGASEDKYERAGRFFREWQQKKILIHDEKPGFYFHSQQYKIKGETRMRQGFIGRLSLQPKNSPVFAHEHTRVEPKEDRYRLIQKVKANLSPIFVVFNDKKRIIHSLCPDTIKQKKPFIELVDDEQIVNKVWRIDEPQVISKMQDFMQNENIFIADGHHRYEVACMYRDKLLEQNGQLDDEAGVNYIMAYFTNTDSRGLTILPIHRLVRFSAIPDVEKLFSQMQPYFDIEPVKDKVRFFFLLEKAGSTEHVIGMYHKHQYWLLRLKNVKILDKLIIDKPREYRSLDVSILNYIVLHAVAGMDIESHEKVAFIPNVDELIEQTDAHEDAIAFLLNPVKIQQIMAVALTGNKMPPKSTYFYPKVLSGLLMNTFE